MFSFPSASASWKATARQFEKKTLNALEHAARENEALRKLN